MHRSVWVVGGIVAVAVTIGAGVFAFQSDSAGSQDDPGPSGSLLQTGPSGSLPQPSALSPPVTIHDEIARREDAPVGSPEPLPLVATRLTAEELQVAEDLALNIPDVADNLSGKRFRVVEAEIFRVDKIASCDDPVARNCAQVGIFNYADGRCIVVLLDLIERKPLDVQLDGGDCSVSAAEIEEARRIAEADPRVQQVIQQGQGKYLDGRIIFPRPGTEIAGHRYVSAKYTLQDGTASAEFVVDLSTQELCYEC